jgi:hypothetical protein
VVMTVSVGLTPAVAKRAVRTTRVEAKKSARSEAPRLAEPRVEGRASVAFATGERTYLDRGLVDGLSLGQTVHLTRNGRTVGNCALEAVSAHEALCKGKFRVGDSFRLEKRSATADKNPVPVLPPMVSPEAADAAATVIAEAPFSKVDFHGKSTTGTSAGAGVTFGHTRWGTTATLGGGYQQERIDLYLRGVDVGRGFLAFAQASAILWTTRPGAPRFRPEGTIVPTPQFYLWEAEVSSRDPNRRFTLSVGRIWPWHAPGLTLLDGAQMGWQSAKRGVEVGGYAGLIPNAVDLAPSYYNWAAGVYSAVSLVRKNLLFHDEARVGVRNLSGAGPVIQVETLAQLWLRKMDVGLNGRVSVAPQVANSLALESANLHLGLRPLSSAVARLRTFLSVRYLGPIVAQEAVLLNERPSLSGSYRGTFDATLEFGRWLGITAFAGGNYDRDTSLYRFYAAGEVRFLRLFRDRVDVTAGYQEEFGWVTGRTVYPQVSVRLSNRLRVFARASYNEERFNDQNRNVVDRDVGFFGSFELGLLRWLELRGMVMARVPLTILGDSNPNFPAALVANLRLAANWN